jgi:hypothetical protein
MLVILVLRRLRQEDQKLEASLGYIVRPGLKQTNKQTNLIKITISYSSKVGEPGQELWSV